MGASSSRVPVQGDLPARENKHCSRLNQTTPKDKSGEEIEVVRMIAEESTPVALTARDVERRRRADQCETLHTTRELA